MSFLNLIWLKCKRLAVWILAFALSLSRWVAVNTDAAQWRLLLPAFPAFAVLLVVGGVLSFLPILGLWMLPLGLLLIAQDVPLLQAPLARMLGWIERNWIERQRAKNAQ